MRDIVFDFNSADNVNRESVWFDVNITSSEMNKKPCDINGWVATGTNYSQTNKMESGKCNGDGKCESIKFYEKYITNGISKWKVWAKDDSSKYFYITLYGRKNNNANIEIETQQLDDSEFVCSALTKNKTYDCCESAITIDVQLARKIIDLDSVDTNYDNAVIMKPLITTTSEDVLITTTNFNDFSYVSGYCTNKEEGFVALTFSSNTNCYKDGGIINNIVYVTDKENEDNTYAFEVRQNSPISKRGFNKHFETKTVAYNTTAVTFSDLTLGTQYFCHEGGDALDDLTENDGIRYNYDSENIEITQVRGNFEYNKSDENSITLTTRIKDNKTNLAEYNAIELYDKISEDVLTLFITRGTQSGGIDKVKNLKVIVESTVSGAYILGGEFVVRVGSNGFEEQHFLLGGVIENSTYIVKPWEFSTDIIYGDKYEFKIEKLYKIMYDEENNESDIINVGDIKFDVFTSYSTNTTKPSNLSSIKSSIKSYNEVSSTMITIDKPSAFNGFVNVKDKNLIFYITLT